MNPNEHDPWFVLDLEGSSIFNSAISDLFHHFRWRDISLYVLRISGEMLSQSCLTELKALVLNAQLLIEVSTSIQIGTETDHIDKELEAELKVQCKTLSAHIRSAAGPRIIARGIPRRALSHPGHIRSWLAKDSNCWKGKLDLGAGNFVVADADAADVTSQLNAIAEAQIWMLQCRLKTPQISSRLREVSLNAQNIDTDTDDDLRRLYGARLVELVERPSLEQIYPAGSLMAYDTSPCPTETRLGSGSAQELPPPSIQICGKDGGVIAAPVQERQRIQVYSHLKGEPILWISIEPRDSRQLQERLRSVSNLESGLHNASCPMFMPSLDQLDRWKIRFTTTLQTAGQILAWHKTTMAFAIKLGACMIHHSTASGELRDAAQSSPNAPSSSPMAYRASNEQQENPTRRVLRSTPRMSKHSPAHKMSKSQGRVGKVAASIQSRPGETAPMVATRSAPSHVDPYLETDDNDDSSSSDPSRESTHDGVLNENASETSTEIASPGRSVQHDSTTSQHENDSYIQAARTLIDFQHSRSPRSMHTPKSPSNDLAELSAGRSSIPSPPFDQFSPSTPTPRNRIEVDFESALPTPPATRDRTAPQENRLLGKRTFAEMLAPDEPNNSSDAAKSILARANELNPQWKKLFDQSIKIGMKAADAYVTIKLALSIGCPSVLAQLAEMCQVSADCLIDAKGINGEFRGYVYAQNGKARMECKSHIHARVLYVYYLEQLKLRTEEAEKREKARPHTVTHNEAATSKPKAAGKALDDLSAACLGIALDKTDIIADFRTRIMRIRTHGRRVYEFDKRLHDAMAQTNAAGQRFPGYSQPTSILALLPLRPITSSLDGTVVRPNDYWNVNDAQISLLAKVLLQREQFFELAERASASEDALLKGIVPSRGFLYNLMKTKPSMIAAARTDSSFLRDLFTMQAD